MYKYFSIGNGQPREPALCQLYRRTFVPYLCSMLSRLSVWHRDTIRYDTIRDAIFTCARKPTWVSLIYRTEPTTKKCKKTEKLKVENRYAGMLRPPMWPRGQIIRPWPQPRPQSFWPRPRSRPHGIQPRPHRNWPRGLEYLQCTWH